ncbi:MAG TPA: monofunctional biosynthetic peptidoglycan transglycosylase [Fibrobacteria bacterium]|nr:monofunctional biosynthetic peptidoglycan transglycosylase [Fibrobacteria bacterium]
MSRSPKPKSPSKSAGRPLRPKLKKGRFRPLRWIRILALGFFASSVAAVLFFRFVPPPFTPLMAIRCFQQALDGHVPALDKDWTRLEKLSPRLAEAVVASEDQRFFNHHGFDFEAIGSAFTVNGRGKRKLGASTITQQTAKNLFLWPDRSWTRKGLEAYFTFLLELLWSKQRILEVYLNVIETGDGAYGAEAAARRYFQVSASALSGPQAALIAAVLPNPRAWSPANPTGYLRRRQTWILRQMDHLGPLPDGLSRRGPGSAEGYASPRPRPAPRKTDSAVPADSEAGRMAPPVSGPSPAPADPPFPEAAPEAESVPAAPLSPLPAAPEPDSAEPAPP